MNKLHYILLFFFSFTFISCSNESDARKIEKMYRKYRQSFAEVPDKSFKSIEALKNDKWIFIDVREDKERAVSVIKGAINKDTYLNNKTKYHDHKIIVYCTIGYRSGLYARELLKERKNIYNLRGGILAWINGGGLLYINSKETKQVHVYGPKWNIVPENHKAVW
jgi:rhodanese-related sulfurtransferase